MTEREFDVQLRAALLESQRRRWASVAGEGPELAWTPERQRVMDRILADPFGYGRRQAMPRWRRTLGRVGQIAACLLLALALTLAAVPEARAWAAEVLQGVREWFTDHVTYRFEGTASIELGSWRPAYVPEGYEETVIYDDAHITYETEDGAWLDFDYKLVEEGSIWHFDNEHSDLTELELNGRAAHLYVSNTEGWPSCLVWLDETGQITYFLMAELPPEEILKIAQSVAPQ